MEVDSANEGGNWIKGRLRGQRWHPKETVCKMSREENTFNTQNYPSLRKIG
jgi:hypothetical protein